MYANNEGSGLMLTDPAIERAVSLAATQDYAGLKLLDLTKKKNANAVISSLGFDKEGSYLKLMDLSGQPRIILVTSKKDTAIVLADSKGKMRFSLSESEEGADLQIFNKTGETVCSLMVDEHGLGKIGAWDRKGNGRTLTPK